ncbi:MAG: 3-deoxy-8-phosphooctulonate synthase, partial [Anaerohalosphaera sp.]|nr:3-deoxy-8-phosphooctulonate synthase [Anaerohalosphaera sp.]
MFKIGDVEIGLDSGLFLMAGPCVLEDIDLCRDIASGLLKVQQETGVGVIFKGSFDKANRSSISSFRGPGIDKGLEILATIRQETGLPVMTDIHEPWQAEQIGKVVDCMQVPAFLCRQTDLLVACAKTGVPTAVKKGQFVSPEEMTNVVGKLKSAGAEKIMLTERGTFFGYNRLVNDMSALTIMKQLGCPVIFDATHSTQQPGGLGDASAGRREMAPILARAAVAAGANGLFLEVHTDPDNAKCDAACVMPIEWVSGLIKDCKAIFEIVNK